jgi:CheY-like chemotaxis protein
MKKTILLVEDSKVQRLSNERILDGAGYLLLFANDGEEALRLVRECEPDLVLLDLLLPRLGGEEVLYSLKRDPLTAHIPVIILSRVQPSQSDKLKALGAADYFEKSRLADAVGQADFLHTIDRVLRESERHEPKRQSTAQRPTPFVVHR